MSPGIRDSRSSAFEALEKDFQEVLQDSYVHPKIHILNSKSWRVDGSDEFPDFNFCWFLGLTCGSTPHPVTVTNESVLFGIPVPKHVRILVVTAKMKMEVDASDEFSCQFFGDI